MDHDCRGWIGVRNSPFVRLEARPEVLLARHQTSRAHPVGDSRTDEETVRSKEIIDTCGE